MNHVTDALWLWLWNTEDERRLLLDLLKEVAVDVKRNRCPALRQGIWTPAQARQFLLEDLLKATFTTMAETDVPALAAASWWSTVFGAAMQDIEWAEIARELIAYAEEEEGR